MSLGRTFLPNPLIPEAKFLFALTLIPDMHFTGIFYTLLVLSKNMSDLHETYLVMMVSDIT